MNKLFYNKKFSRFVLLIVIIFSSSVLANSATFTVTRTDDRNDVCASGVSCSLREAVKAASSAAGNDVIEFSPELSLITLINEIEIIVPVGSIIISGRGADIFTIDGGAGNNRIFNTLFATVTISGMTLTGGNGRGGNRDGFGGAIYADGASVTIESVHVTGNTAFGNAGGGVSFLNGTHRIVNSTFSANTAFNCGGISNSSSLLTIINSTISGNSVSQLGGGLCANGNTTLRNVTITNNTAALGGGILKAATGTLNLSNTIVAGNGATEILFNAGAIISAGNNLIGDSPGEAANTGQFMSVVYHPSDILNTPPMLGTLQNNGGTTPTHAPLFNSPVIDAGSNALTFEPFDQRGAGFPRIVDGDGNGSAIVDIGAFELQPPVVLPDQLIGNLIGTIGNFIDNPNPRLRAGIERNLIARLENALADLAAGDTQGARNEIEAFINLVRSLSGKLISQQRADELIAEANKILEAINSQQ